MNKQTYHNIRFFMLVVVILAILSTVSSARITHHYQTNGLSMYPTINESDRIGVYKFKSFEQPRLNDIVLFRVPFTVVGVMEEGNLVTHRLIGIRLTNGERTYLTKGDNNNITDPWGLNRKDILGKVVKVI